MRDDSDFVELLRAAARGDRRAFEEVVLARRETVVRIARRIVGDPEDARDVAQAVFLKLWKVLRRFDVERRFDTWLYRITVNAAIDHLREGGPKGFLQPLPDDPAALAGAVGDAGRDLDLGELRRAFLRLAAGLAPKQRAIFVLREVEGMETPEIARTLGVTESTVRNHLHQARRSLREGLRRDYPALVPKGSRS